MRRVRLVLVALVSSLIFAAVAAQEETYQRPERIRVAVVEGPVPYVYTDDQGRLQGVVIDLWKAWGARQNIAIDFVVDSVDAGLNATAFGDVDVHMGMFGEYIPRPGLMKAKPYYGYSVALYHVPGMAVDLPFLRVAVTEDMGFSPEFTRFVDRAYSVEIVVDSTEAAIDAVLNGEADAAMVSSQHHADGYIIEAGAQGRIISEPSLTGLSLLYPQVPADQPHLRELIDDGFDGLPRAILSEIETEWLSNSSHRYFSLQNDQVRLNPAEREFIAQLGEVEVLFPEDPFAPFYFDNGGTVSGIDLDVLQLLKERLGINFVPRTTDSFTTALELLKNNDRMMLTSVTESSERSQYMTFSDPYYDSKNAVITRRDVVVRNIRDLRFKIVAIPEGWRIGDVLQEEVPEARIVRTRNINEALSMVANGTAYAFVGNRVNSSFEIDRSDFTNLKVALPVSLGEAPLRFGFNASQTTLAQIINKGLATVTEQELTTIKNRWYRVQFDDRDQLVRVYRNLGIIGLIIAGIFVGIFIWNQRLRREVQAREVVEKKLIAAREAAEAAAAAKTSFLATMSHEIRTPLNGVLGMLEVLAKTSLDKHQREQVNTIQQSGKSLLDIINDVLDFSKIDAGKLSLEVLPTNLPELIEGIYELLQPTASKKGLSLKYTITGAEESFYLVDPTRVRQVVMNLLSNAVKFTESGEVEIKLDIRPVGKRFHVEISVIDTGIGIDGSSLDRIFVPFEQAETSTSRRFGGTGLGLSISKRIADLMGGALTLRPREPQGTQATFSFDVISCDPVASRHEDTAELSELEPVHLLLVEDHPTNQKVTSAQLQSLGLTCDVAENGQEGLELLEKPHHYALVLSDCHMPVMDGYEMVAQLRSIEKDAGAQPMVVVATTANALSGERDHCLSVGFSDYLAKPFSTEELHKVLSKYLAKKGELPHPTSPSDSEKHTMARVSFDSLRQLIADEEQVKEIVVEFLESTHDDIQAMLTAELVEDIEQLQQAVHRIKGTAPMVGAEQLGEFCRAIDQSAKLGDWSEWRSNRDDFLDVWREFVDAATDDLHLDAPFRSRLLNFD